jgi:hypothetical protein
MADDPQREVEIDQGDDERQVEGPATPNAAPSTATASRAAAWNAARGMISPTRRACST